MKVKMLVVTRLLVFGAAAALSFSMAGAASASPLGHPKHHKPKPKHHAVTQVTGKQLKSALLSGSAFDIGYASAGELDTGGSLLSSRVTQGAGSIPCDQLGVFAIGQGQTAEAFDEIGPPSSNNSPSLLLATQNISQFANSQTAWSFLGQEQARFSACQSYNENLAGSGAVGSGGAIAITIESVSRTKVGNYPAFTVAQSAELSESEGTGTFYIDTTVVQAGTNVYSVQEWNSVDGTVPGWMLSKVISQTQKLYQG